MVGQPPPTAPEGATGAFGADTLPRLLADLQEFSDVALAVSGGADSTALMVLVRRWLDLGPERSPRITVLTVDHKLRAASAIEAGHVREQATALGFAHQMLEWTEPKPKAGIQAVARKARYSLMASYCRHSGIAALATGHTQDDQAETVLMRLARGGGVDGLSAMTPRAQLSGLALLRPLLGVPRAELRGYLAQSRISWSEDPTNENADYERVRIRRALADPAAIGLSREKLALTAARLRRARRALDAEAAAALRALLRLEEAGWASMPLDAFATAEEEIAIRMLGRLALAIGGGRTPVPLAKVEAACETLRRAPNSLTLGGCQLTLRDGGELRITREYGRMRRQEAAFTPGMLWDRRFIIEAPPALAAAPAVRSLGPDGVRLVKAVGGDFGPMPRGAALTLPSLWRGGDLVYAPFAHFIGAPPPAWLPASVNFANRNLLFDQQPEIRL
jgi:tRNA(Ile)-lysidine synthase